MEDQLKSKHELFEEIGLLKQKLEQLNLQLNREKSEKLQVEILLEERLKELKCLNEITRIFVSGERDVNVIVRKIMETIPPGMKFPEIAEASITIHDKVYQTAGFTKSEYTLEQLIYIEDVAIGKIAVCYPEEKYTNGKDVFLKEEGDLLFTISVRISGYLAQKTEEQKARESSTLYHSFVQASPDAIAITDLTGKIEFISPSAYQLFGYSTTENLTGYNILDFISPSEHQRAGSRIADMFSGLFAGAEEYKSKKADGTTFWIEVSGDFIRNEAGEPVKMIFVSRNASQRKDMEEQLRKSEEMYRSLVESSDAAIFMTDHSGKYLYVNTIEAQRYDRKPEEMTGNNIKDFLPADEIEKMLADIKKVIAENRGFIVEVASEFKGVVKNYRISLQPVRDINNVPFAVLFLVNDITEMIKTSELVKKSEARFRQLVETINDAIYEIGADATIKYVSPSIERIVGYTQEELIGKNFFDFMYPDDRPMLYDAMQKLGTLSFAHLEYRYIAKNGDIRWVRSSTTPVFKDGKLVGGNGSLTDITEQKKNEIELKRREFQHTEAQKLAKLGHWELDFGSNKLSWSEEIYRMFEIDPDKFEATYEAFLNAIHPDDRQMVNDAFSQSLQNKTGYDVIHRLLMPGGEIKYVNERCVTEFDVHGNPLRSLGTVMDITKQFLVEEQLRVFKMATDAANYGIAINKLDGEFIYTNDAWAQMHGYNIDELIGKNISIGHTPGQMKEIGQAIEDLFLTGSMTSKELWHVRKDGSEFPTLMNATVIKDKENKPLHLSATVIDITDKKLSDEALKNQKEQLQAIVKAIPDIMFVIDKNGTYLEYYASDRHLLLVPRDKIIGLNMKDSFPPDDYRLHMTNVNKCIEKQSIVEYEYSIKTPVGEMFFDSRIVPMSNGNVLCFIRDITDRKNNEFLIRRLSQAVEQSPVMTLITDRKGNIEYVNRSFEIITGYSADDVKGKNPRMLKSGRTEKETYKKLWETITNGKSWSGEWLNRKKDGSLYWEDVTISPITNEKDEIVNFIALKQDSTQRKESELKLLNFYNELEQKVIERTGELAEKTRELENFFNVSLDLLCIADTNGNFIKVNKAWEDILGYPVAELESHKFLDFVHPDDLQATYDAIATLQDNKKVLKFINRYRTINGDYRFIEWHSVPVGETIYAAARDITESRLNADFQSELLMLSSKLTGIPFSEIIPSIEMALMNIGKFLSADRAYIFEYDENLTHFSNTFEWCEDGVEAQIENLQNIPNDIFPEWQKQILQFNDIIIPDVSLLPDTWAAEKEFIQGQDIKSMVIIPLMSESRLIGFAGLDYVKLLRNFSEFEIKILKLWSTMLAGLINNFKVEKLLEQARQNMAIFFNTVDDFLFVLDESGNMIFVNETVKRRLGYSNEELIGNTVLIVHPENRREEAGRIVNEMLEGKAESCPVPVIDKNGKLIEVETRVKKGMWNGKPAIFGVTKDISQIKLSEEKFATAFHTNVSLMAISNISDSRYVEVNESFLKVLGYTREEVIGKTSTDLGIFADAPVDIEMKKHLMKNEPVRDVELRVKTKSGEIRTGLFSIDIITIGSEKKYLATMVDITERKKMEREMINARNEAERANSAKSEFLSRMSHELRTPMNSILGFAQLLEMGALNDRQKNGVFHILRSGKYLLNMINEVLELSRIESGRLSLSMEPVGVNAVVFEVLEIVRPQSEQKNISILNKVISNELYVSADKQKLKQVLVNITGNAIKYNNTGGRVEIAVDIIKHAGKNDEYVRISVADNGPGISEENLEKIFSPFERVGADKTAIEGTGLGLAVSKKLTEAMKGTIGVESKFGEGSNFWIEFQFVTKGEKTKEHIETGNEESFVDHTISGKVLYFEDNESNIELIDQIITESRPGVKFLFQKDGANSIEFISEVMPDLILLDLNLVGKQGDKILVEILNEPGLKDIPVVMVSADAMPHQIRNLLSLGARSYLTKPVIVSQLLKTIDQYLKK